MKRWRLVKKQEKESGYKIKDAMKMDEKRKRQKGIINNPKTGQTNQT